MPSQELPPASSAQSCSPWAVLGALVLLSALTVSAWWLLTPLRFCTSARITLPAARECLRAPDVAGGKKSSGPGTAACCSPTRNNFSAAAARPLGQEFWVSLLAAASENVQMRSCAAQEQGWSGKKRHAADFLGPRSTRSPLAAPSYKINAEST